MCQPKLQYLCSSPFDGVVVDIDECTTGVGVCHGETKCVNMPGTFVCRCREGYTGIGSTCTGIITIMLGLA